MVTLTALQGQCIITKLLICWGNSTIYTSPVPSLIVWHLSVAVKEHTAGEGLRGKPISQRLSESQWAYFCLTELHKGSLQRGKKPRLWCKKRFLKQKTLFGRDNIKIGTISAFFLLLRLQWGNLRSWKNALKMQSADRCEGSRQILGAVSFIRAGRLEDSPACWIILDLHSLWSNPLQEWSPHVSLSLCLLFFLLTPLDS